MAEATGYPLPTSGIDRWPGGERRSPPRSDPHYLVLAPLAKQLEVRIGRALEGRTDAAVLDIGCGGKPYLPFAAPHAASYCGIDSAPGPMVDVVVAAEELPFEDASFDLVLCTQVLEHVQDPAATLSEIHRVLRPGGTALVSTHGVFLYHPDPPSSDQDYWRWTHAGLRKQIATAGAWDSLEVEASGDVVACLAYVAVQFVDGLGRRVMPGPLRRAVLRMWNWAAERLDARFPPNTRFPANGSLSANYLVTAVRA